MQASVTPIAKASSLPSSWRVVEARVLVSLSPAELCSPRARANVTRRALSGLLMRHQPALGGVVVAHRGGLRFPDGARARLLGASPFAHISAAVTLLVFAPRSGDRLRAVVAHVGPDHVGLTLWNTFHVVLPLAEMGERFSYDPGDRKWRNSECPDGAKDIGIDATVLLSVVGLRHTHSGLFHVAATFLDSNGDACDDLGVFRESYLDKTGDRNASDEVIPPISIMDDPSDDGELHTDDEVHASVLQMTPGHRPSKPVLYAPNQYHDADFDDALGTPGSTSVLVKKRTAALTSKKKKKADKKKTKKSKKTKKAKKSEHQKSKVETSQRGAPVPAPSPPIETPTAPSTAKIEDQVFISTMAPPSYGTQAKLEPKLEDLPEESSVTPEESNTKKHRTGRKQKQGPAIGSLKEGAVKKKRSKGKKDKQKRPMI
jgi:hypothetical protein